MGGKAVMARQENQRVMLTRRLIREGLMELLKTESIHKITVRALCEGAGINRSTFYRYYGSQYDVLAEMEEQVLGDVGALLQQAPSATDRETLEAICAYFEQHMDSVRVMVSNNVDPEFPRKLFGMPQVRDMILARLDPAADAEQQNYLYIFLVNGAYHLVREWIDNDRGRPFKEIAYLLEDIIDRLCRP